jgi:hypothetical protein
MIPIEYVDLKSRRWRKMVDVQLQPTRNTSSIDGVYLSKGLCYGKHTLTSGG